MGSELFLNPEFFKKSASRKLIQEMANKNSIEKINLTPFPHFLISKFLLTSIFC